MGVPLLLSCSVQYSHPKNQEVFINEEGSLSIISSARVFAM